MLSLTIYPVNDTISACRIPDIGLSLSEKRSPERWSAIRRKEVRRVTVMEAIDAGIKAAYAQRSIDLRKLHFDHSIKVRQETQSLSAARDHAPIRFKILLFDENENNEFLFFGSF